MLNFWVTRMAGYVGMLVISVSLFQVEILFFLPMIILWYSSFLMSKMIARLLFPVSWKPEEQDSRPSSRMNMTQRSFNKWFYGEVVLAFALTAVHFQVLHALGAIVPS